MVIADRAQKSYDDFSVILESTLPSHFLFHLMETLSPDALSSGVNISEMILDEVAKHFRPISISTLDELVVDVAAKIVCGKNSFMVVKTIVNDWVKNMDKEGWMVELSEYVISSQTCSWGLVFKDGKSEHISSVYSLNDLVRYATLKSPSKIYAFPTNSQSPVRDPINVIGYLIRKVGDAKNE